MNREYFTDFEELNSGNEMSGCQERDIRTVAWTVEDFIPVFTSVGLVMDGEVYSSTKMVQTGRMVVNGRETIQQAEHKISFRFDNGFVGEMDGSLLAGIWVTVTVNGQSLLSELIYCVPDDIRLYHTMYTNGK